MKKNPYIFLTKYIIFILCLFATKLSTGICIGRENELKTLKNYIVSGKTIIVITGMSGIGKTTLAKEFVNTNINRYDFVWWFYGEQDFDQQMINFGHHLNQLEHKSIVNAHYSRSINLEKIKSYLQNSKKRGLFILDNFFNLEGINNIPSRSNFTFIVTSLNSFSVGKIMMLDKLTKSAASKLIMSRVNCGQDDANLLAQELSYHPLALTQATAYILTHPEISIEKYLDFYKKSLGELWKLEEDLKKEGLVDKTVYSTIYLVLDRLKKDNPQGHELLTYFAIYNKNIPEVALKKIYLDNIEDNELRFFNALYDLKKYSLLTESGYGDKQYFSCHDMISKVLKIELKSKGIKERLKKVILSYAQEEYMHPADYMYYAVKDEALQSYINILASIGNKEGVVDGLDKVLLNAFQFFLIIKKNYAQAEEVMKQLDTYYSALKSFDQLSKSRYHCLKGILYAWNYVDYVKSNAEHESALNIIKRFSLPTEEQIYPYLQLAQNYCFMGDLMTATKYAAEAQKHIKTEDVRNREILKLALAMIDLGNGNYKTALNIMQSIDLFSLKSYKDVEPYHLEWWIIYGKILGRAKKESEAYKILSTIYDSFEENFGTKIHDTYMSLCATLADICRLKKDFISMKKYLLEMKKYIPKVYQEEDINQAEYYRLQGDLAFAQANYKLAFHNYSVSDGMYSRIFSKLMHDDINYIWTQQMRVCIKLKLDKEYSQYLDKYRNTFGDKNLENVLKLL